MSMPKNVMIACPRCKKQYQVRIWQSVNTEIEDVAEKIVSGELFTAHCPQCGFDARLEYDVLYNDMEHGAWIHVIHPTATYEKDYAEVVAAYEKHRMVNHFRVVNSIEQLQEKVLCIENGRDDRIIEICKLVLESETQYQLGKDNCQIGAYQVQNGQESFVCICESDGSDLPFNVVLPDGLYEYAQQVFGHYIDRKPSYVYNRAWAENLMRQVAYENSSPIDDE